MTIIIKNPFKGKVPPTTPASDPIHIQKTTHSDVVKTMDMDYKLSSVSPEGTFIPPSPPEKASFMSRFRSTGQATRTREVESLADSGFVIPRASFDSYRRSFDIRPSIDGSPSTADGRSVRASVDLLSSSSSRQHSYQQLHPNTKAADFSHLALTTHVSDSQRALADPVQLADEFEDVKLDDELPRKRFWQRTKQKSRNENELSDIAVTDEVKKENKIATELPTRS